MLSEKLFKQRIAILAENFNFQPSPEYLKLIFRGIKDKTSDKIFSQRVEGILLGKKISEWNKDFGFGGKPAVADCIEMFCVKRYEQPCKLYFEFGAWRSARLESYDQALKRENGLIDSKNQQLMEE